jgi:hypothetical protein
VVDAFTTDMVAGIEVNADTVTSLIHSGEIEVDGLSARERNTVLQLCEVATRRARAAMTVTVDSADRSGSFGADGHASIRGWGKALCRWSDHEARTQRCLMQLIRHHDLTRREYLAGRLGHAQAVLLAKLALHPRVGHLYSESEELLVADAQGLDYEAFKTVTDRWLLLADLDGADQDEALKHYLRSGCVITDADGMTHVDARVAGAQGATMKAIFDRFYQAETDADYDIVRTQRANDGDPTPVAKHDLPRTDDQRRADALFTIFSRAASAPLGSKTPEPVVNILVDHDTLEHLIARECSDEEVGPLDPSTYRDRRCETSTGQPVAPSDVLAAAMIGQIRRVVVESPSTVTDLGRRSRCFTGSARTAAKLLQPRCTYPGCGLPAEWCQVDHVQSWQHHGETKPRNADIDCGRHNRWKELGYHTQQLPNGHHRTFRPDGTEIRAV